jgi:hypothetical protein
MYAWITQAARPAHPDTHKYLHAHRIVDEGLGRFFKRTSDILVLVLII